MSEYDNDGFDDASMMSAGVKKMDKDPSKSNSKKKPPTQQSLNSFAESKSGNGGGDDDLKIDSNQMFKIDFSHLENIMQGFQSKIDGVSKKMKNIEKNNVAQQKASNAQINKFVKKLETEIEGANQRIDKQKQSNTKQ